MPIANSNYMTMAELLCTLLIFRAPGITRIGNRQLTIGNGLLNRRVSGSSNSQLLPLIQANVSSAFGHYSGSPDPRADRGTHCGADSAAGNCTDHGANAQRYERPGPQRFFQPMLWLLGIGDQLVDGLLGKILTGQKRPPCCRTNVAESIWAVETFSSGPNQHVLNA